MIIFIRIINALVWVVGLILLFIFPPAGIPILIVALILSIITGMAIRSDRHRALLAAVQHPESPEPLPPSEWTKERDLAAQYQAQLEEIERRLDKLSNLYRDGLISESEHKRRRQQIIDDI